MSVKSRPLSCRISRKNTRTVKKKPAPRQEWDSSVQDLTVHRATPEELAHRHEMHKSKNRCPAQMDLLRKRLAQKQGRSPPDPLEERRLARMMEILSDQYKTRAALEEADRAMSVVNDLFGDGARRRTGYPNVTVAPFPDLHNSRSVLIQRKDPPTRLSTLSESVMDSQALNDVDESWSEKSDDEVERSTGFQSGFSTDRLQHILNEESLHLDHHQPTGPFVTPKGSNQPIEGHLALNATAAVKKMKTRLTREEQQEDESSVIGRVLNPKPKIHKDGEVYKGKKTRPSHATSTQTADPPASCAVSHQPSLDHLNNMIKEVERDLEACAQESGWKMPHIPQAQGVTGFSLSLVISIKQLLSYVKECHRQVQQAATERQWLRKELDEQRQLIDALTAEILLLKEGTCTLRSEPGPKSPSCSAACDRATTETTTARNLQSDSPVSSVCAMLASVITELGLQEVDGELCSESPPNGRHSSDSVMSSRQESCAYSFPAAVLLSPPRQKTRPQASAALSGLHTASSTPSGSEKPGARTKEVPVPSICANTQEQMSELPSDIQSPSTPGGPPASCPVQEACKPRDEDSAPQTPYSYIASQMAELTKQNNLLKAQVALHSGNSPTRPSTKVVTPGQGPTSLDQRIAELNRQSAEARDKLLNLIQQQKMSAIVSPAISPITPQREEAGGRERRIDAGIPMPGLADSSVEETPSPASRDSGRRSSASQRSCSSAGGRAASDGHQIRKRACELQVPAIPAPWSLRQPGKEDGWFALSTHVS